jgi:hypothetical protein
MKNVAIIGTGIDNSTLLTKLLQDNDVVVLESKDVATMEEMALIKTEAMVIELGQIKHEFDCEIYTPRTPFESICKNHKKYKRGKR